MNKKCWVVFAVIVLTLVHPLGAWAQKEKEPNNTEDKATAVKAGIVQARANDKRDWFKVSLPAAGPVSLRVTGLPQGMNVQIGVKGLAPVGWQDGKGDTEYRFEATDTDGLIWVMFQFAESVCGGDWCAARMVPGGPWYGVRPSAKMPAAHNGEPIRRQALPYKLRIASAGAAAPKLTKTVKVGNGTLSRDASMQSEDEPDKNSVSLDEIFWKDV